MRTYILDDDRSVRPCSSGDSFHKWHSRVENRRVKFSKIIVDNQSNEKRRQIEVSTMFVGTAQGSRDGRPLLFETMVFDRLGPMFERHYLTWEEAERGHNQVVREVTQNPPRRPT